MHCRAKSPANTSTKRNRRDDDRSFPPESHGNLFDYAKKLGTSARQLAFAEGLFARGLVKKAKRAVACGRLAGRVRCIDFHFYRQPFYCGLRACPRCGRVAMGRLRTRYASVLKDRIPSIEAECRRHEKPSAYLRIEFSTALVGPPSPKTVRAFNEGVKRWFASVQESSGLPPTASGALWSTTIKGNRIVAHARYLGPQLSNDMARGWRELWGPSAALDIRRKDVGPDSLDRLNDVLATPVDLSAAELADVEAAGERIRFTHSIGAFYASPPPAEEAEAATCPQCNKPLFATGGWTFVTQLEAENCRDLAEVRRELRANGRLGPGPPGGQAALDGADRGWQDNEPADSEPWNRSYQEDAVVMTALSFGSSVATA